MKDNQDNLKQKIKKLEFRLKEAENVLQAIREGHVDAFIIQGQASKKKVMTLEAAEHPYKVLVETMHEGAVTLVREGTIIYANDFFSQLVGLKINKIIGTSIYNYIDPRQVEILKKSLAVVNEDGIQQEFNVVSSKKRQKKIVYFSMRTLKLDFTEAICIVVTDITQLKKVESALRQNEEKYSQLLELSPYGIFVLFRKKIVYANTAFTDMLAIDKKEILNKSVMACFDKANMAEISSFFEATSKQKPRFKNQQVFCWKRLDGKKIHLQIIGKEFPYHNSKAIQFIVNDITSRKNMEHELQYLATHDQLTGLANLNSFKTQLDVAIERARSYDEKLALILFDIDSFKNINDAFGHEVGDKTLKVITSRITERMGKNSVVARIGGDEFMLMITHIRDIPLITLAAEKVQSVFKQPFIINGIDFDISISMGISVYPYNGEDSEALIKNCDFALVSAKKIGHGAYKFATAEIELESKKRILLEKDLNKALSKNQFDLFYQPKVDLKTGKIVSVEALLRWFHSSGKILCPGEFISLAEDSGLIVTLGQWILEKACMDYLKWQNAGLSLNSVSVNVSPVQLARSDIKKTLTQVIVKTGINPRNLELEITENLLIQDPMTTVVILNKLRDMGVKLSIDDFGTGYSSLGYMKNFKVDFLKIDKSFTFNIDKNKHSEAIIRAVIALGHKLGFQIIAEGVETIEQLKMLKKYECDQIQGYYVSKPIPYSKMTQLLDSNWKLPKID